MSTVDKDSRSRVLFGDDYGNFSISGTTKVTGIPNAPVRRKVRLHDQITGRPMRDVWSDALTGEYTFSSIRAGIYSVTTFDHTGAYNGEIATDIVVPTP